ncbi:hypothetical protein 2017DRC82_0195 [Vibrio phage ICP1]|nr:hypothetical protein 2017DRC82_0195 [Vibrio phage ICP1]
MEWYYILMLSPAIIVTLWGYHKQKDARWSSKITTKELILSFGINMLVALVSIGLMQMFKYGQVSDYYILNGKVVEKFQDTVSCEHSYQVCSGSGNNRTCSTRYEHLWDYDWVVKTTVGNLTIDRVDRQGVDEPPRFKSVVIGEPAAVRHQYHNYLLADESSLFMQNVKGGLGVREANVYDYYRTKHVIGEKYLPDLELELQRILQGKGFNLTVVTLVDKPVESFFDLVKDWKGGKINEITLVVGLNTDDNVVWVKGNSYAKGYKNQLLLKELESLVMVGGLTVEVLDKVVDKANYSFILHNEGEFKEKLDLVEIPLWLTIILTLVNFGLSIVVHNKMKEYDL